MVPSHPGERRSDWSLWRDLYWTYTLAGNCRLLKTPAGASARIPSLTTKDGVNSFRRLAHCISPALFYFTTQQGRRQKNGPW